MSLTVILLCPCWIQVFFLKKKKISLTPKFWMVVYIVMKWVFLFIRSEKPTQRSTIWSKRRWCVMTQWMINSLCSDSRLDVISLFLFSHLCHFESLNGCCSSQFTWWVMFILGKGDHFCPNFVLQAIFICFAGYLYSCRVE